jgi:hypothetical protein
MEYDRHVCGLFARDEWLQLLRDVGFEPEVVPNPYEREVFVRLKKQK